MAEEKQYLLGWAGDTESFRDAKHLGLIALHALLFKRQGGKGPYSLKERGHHTEFGPERKFRDHWTRLRTVLIHAEIGDTYFSKPSKGRTASIRVVKRIVRTPQGTIPSTGTPDVKRVYQEVTARFDVSSLGICNCRKIDGSSTWSEHAWCDAWDIHGTVAELDRVNRYLLDNKARLNIRNVLWHYPGHYPGHIHVDFNPSHAGQTPPCA